MKRIPYGISNFEELRQKGYLYVDKTYYIEVLENNAPYQFFIRPRRFGKTLFLSMLENYYDLLKKDKFESLFKDLYIEKHPTPERNSYLVLHLSFADLVTSEGKQRFIKSFDDSVISRVRTFLRLYGALLGDSDLPENITGAEMAMRYIVEKAASNGQKIFLLIDEYDNFANDLIGTGNKSLYYDLLTGEGYVRAFYKTIKDGTTRSISRLFMTGVSPIMLDDLTSGFNITKNMTLQPELNEMLGFTREELNHVLNELNIDPNIERPGLLKDMELYYNGYLFNKEGKERVYNSNMVLYFLDGLTRYGKYPENILDVNIKTDYKKIETMAFNFEDEEMIQRLMTEGQVSTNIVERFNLEYIYEKKENFISLLFYMGMLTIKEARFNTYVLSIPNYVIKTIYWEYLLDKIGKFQVIKNDSLFRAVEEMAVEGKTDKLQNYLKDFIGMLSNRDLINLDEKHIKMVLMALFYQSGIYLVNSEYEVEKGYIDIYLSKNRAYEKSIKYEWLIELKYIKESERDKLEDIKAKGLMQLAKYSEGKKIAMVEDLKTILLIFVGKNDVHLLPGSNI